MSRTSGPCKGTSLTRSHGRRCARSGPMAYPSSCSGLRGGNPPPPPARVHAGNTHPSRRMLRGSLAILSKIWTHSQAGNLPYTPLHLLSHPLRPPRRALPSRPRREVAHPAPHRRSLVRWASPLRALNAPDWSNFTSRRFDSHCPPFCLSIVTASVCSRFSLRVSLSVSICLRVYTVFLPAFPSVVSSSYYLCCVTYASVCSRFSLRISQLVSICLRIYTVFFLPAFPSAVSSSYYLCCVT